MEQLFLKEEKKNSRKIILQAARLRQGEPCAPEGLKQLSSITGQVMDLLCLEGLGERRASSYLGTPGIRQRREVASIHTCSGRVTQV